MTALPTNPVEPPDIHSSSREYANRFAGTAGRWLLQVQSSTVVRMLPAVGHELRVLDIGGGHGQIAMPLVSEGHRVTITGSRPECADNLHALLEQSHCRFLLSDLLHLPFADCAFDIVTCFRIVSHMPAWKHLLAELARVSRFAVLIDYPSAHSINALTPLLFPIKRRAEGNTREYLSFNDEEVLAVFRESGFVLNERFPQFFVPMVIHRKLGAPRLSRFIESAAQRTGLAERWGSPIILKVIRERE